VEAVAAAVIGVLTTALVQDPRRVGKPLRGELARIWSARRGTYRVLYRLLEEKREVIVVRVEHRRVAYPTQAAQSRPGPRGVTGQMSVTSPSSTTWKTS
jgi:mRNA-degrading endonuclease RelE of RelBE toxin-antitoxin system